MREGTVRKSYKFVHDLEYPFLKPVGSPSSFGWKNDLRILDDIIRSVFPERDASGEFFAVEPRILEGWVAKSPDSWLVLRSKDGRISAFANVQVIRGNIAQAIIAGEAEENEIRPADILAHVSDANEDDYMHIGLMVVHNRGGRTYLPSGGEHFKRLLAGVSDRINRISLACPEIHKIIAVSYPDATGKIRSRKLLSEFGFSISGKDSHGYDVYTASLREYDESRKSLLEEVRLATTRHEKKRRRIEVATSLLAAAIVLLLPIIGVSTQVALLAVTVLLAVLIVLGSRKDGSLVEFLEMTVAAFRARPSDND